MTPMTVFHLPPDPIGGDRYGVPTGEGQGATVTVSYHCSLCRSVACEHIKAVTAYRAAEDSSARAVAP